jgi:hypothetical protein
LKIRQGKYGGCLFLMHAGRPHDTADTPDDERSSPPQNTVPNFILPGCTLRPDLLLITGWTPPPSAFDSTTNSYDLSRIPAHQLPTPSPEITLVYADIKVCRDTGVQNTLTHNWSHYKELIQQIRSRGWRVLGQNPDGTITDTAEGMITIPFGNTGLNYRGTFPALQAFGICRAHAHRLHKEATRITTDWATTLINQKRLLESNLDNQTTRSRHHTPRGVNHDSRNLTHRRQTNAANTLTTTQRTASAPITRTHPTNTPTTTTHTQRNLSSSNTTNIYPLLHPPRDPNNSTTTPRRPATHPHTPRNPLRPQPPPPHVRHLPSPRLTMTRQHRPPD